MLDARAEQRTLQGTRLSMQIRKTAPRGGGAMKEMRGDRKSAERGGQKAALLKNRIVIEEK